MWLIIPLVTVLNSASGLIISDTALPSNYMMVSEVSCWISIQVIKQFNSSSVVLTYPENLWKCSFTNIGWNGVNVRLCHVSCIWSGSSDLIYTLKEIREFLNRNPEEIVTIIFEDYLRNPRILRKVFDDADVSRFVFTSNYWSEYEDWPTLSTMISLGRRLVVFSNVGLIGFPYAPRNMWNFVIESRYGNPGKHIGVSYEIFMKGWIWY